MNERGNGDLQSELDRIREERDDYRQMAAELLKRDHDIDLDELEAELREWKEKGKAVPFSQIVDMLKTEFGITL